MADFEMATSPSVVLDREFVVPIEEIDRLRAAKEMALGDGVIFQPEARRRWHLPSYGTHYGVMTALDVAGGIIDPGGGLEEVEPAAAVFQERASVEIPYDSFLQRCLQRVRRKRPEEVTATVKRQRLTKFPVHTTFASEHEPRVSLTTPPPTQTARVDRNIKKSLLDPGCYVPSHVTTAVGVLMDRTVQFSTDRPMTEGRVTNYTGKEFWTTRQRGDQLPAGDTYSVTLAVEHPGFWRSVQSIARARRPRSKATLTRGPRW